MRIQGLIVWTLLLKLLALGYAASYHDFGFPIDLSPVHNYSRSSEISKHCSPFLPLASELESNYNWASKLKKELSFFNGDWEQDYHGASLMPFDDSDMPQETFSFISPWKLVSFEVKNVSSGATNQPKNTVIVSGVLSIGITRNSTVISEPGLNFHKRPGMSALRVDFEGLYLETNENQGERLVCLLGNSTSPFKKVPTRFSDDEMASFFAPSDLYNEDPVILPHDQMLLVLRYPKTPSFSISKIHGEMTSLNENKDFEYFDKVHITSHSGVFDVGSSEDLVFESFDQNPLQAAMVEDGVHKFNNSEMCRILKYFEHDAYRVMPNLKLGGQNWFQDTVGPFLLKNEIQLVDRDNENLRILFHNIRCHEEKVSGVLRMYPATMEPHVAARRTGLSTLTLSVDGTWSSSTGLLSMKGCLGPMLEKCDSGILLYFPESFSSRQRSVVSGSIFSLENATYSYHPVFIGLEMLSPGRYSSIYLSYNYSKIGLAIELQERRKEPQLLTYIRTSLFEYPAFEEEEKDGIFKLSDDLRIYAFTSFETFVRVDVMSIGPLFRTYDGHFHEVFGHEVLNVSMNLLIVESPTKVKEESYRHVSKLYLEGLYDQRVGKLYLIGCRKVSFDHIDLERGLDCSIEVIIEYSPVNTRWMINPTAKISIISQRNEDDIYHFKPIRLRTFMLYDKNHEKNILFRKIFEGYLRVLLLLVLVLHVSNQIKNMKKSPESVIYISLVMLGLWISGYGINLMCGKEILIIPSESQRYTNNPYDHQSYRRYLNTIDYFSRFLVLVFIFLLARISQMVLKARKVLRDQGESTPSEKKVIVISMCIYICYLFLRIVEKGIYLIPLQETLTKEGVYMKLFIDMLRLDVYKLQDFFMIPQIVGFRIWKPRHPQLRSFINGLWIPFLVVFVYEFVRDPVDYPVLTQDNRLNLSY